MCGQEMGRRNMLSGHVCAIRNVSSQCVVSVTAKSDTQDAGALFNNLNKNKIYYNFYYFFNNFIYKKNNIRNN